LIETRHVKAALKAMTVKTDRNDAGGMAQLMRMGWFRPVHVKTVPAQEIRMLRDIYKCEVGCPAPCSHSILMISSSVSRNHYIRGSPEGRGIYANPEEFSGSSGVDNFEKKSSFWFRLGSGGRGELGDRWHGGRTSRDA
jgi:hypothetical protein